MIGKMITDHDRDLIIQEIWQSDLEFTKNVIGPFSA